MSEPVVAPTRSRRHHVVRCHPTAATSSGDIQREEPPVAGLQAATNAFVRSATLPLSYRSPCGSVPPERQISGPSAGNRATVTGIVWTWSPAATQLRPRRRRMPRPAGTSTVASNGAEPPAAHRLSLALCQASASPKSVQSQHSTTRSKVGRSARLASDRSGTARSGPRRSSGSSGSCSPRFSWRRADVAVRVVDAVVLARCRFRRCRRLLLPFASSQKSPSPLRSVQSSMSSSNTFHAASKSCDRDSNLVVRLNHPDRRSSPFHPGCHSSIWHDVVRESGRPPCDCDYVERGERVVGRARLAGTGPRSASTATEVTRTMRSIVNPRTPGCRSSPRLMHVDQRLVLRPAVIAYGPVAWCRPDATRGRRRRCRCPCPRSQGPAPCTKTSLFWSVCSSAISTAPCLLRTVGH